MILGLSLDLNQKDGERIQATLAQNQQSDHEPWRIDATLAKSNPP